MILPYKLGDDGIKRCLLSFAIFFEIRKYFMTILYTHTHAHTHAPGHEAIRIRVSWQVLASQVKLFKSNFKL